MAKSPRWRAANRAYNRDGLRQAIKEAQEIKKAHETGEAKVENFTLHNPDDPTDSLTIRQTVWDNKPYGQEGVEPEWENPKVKY